MKMYFQCKVLDLALIVDFDTSKSAKTIEKTVKEKLAQSEEFAALLSEKGLATGNFSQFRLSKEDFEFSFDANISDVREIQKYGYPTKTLYFVGFKNQIEI